MVSDLRSDEESIHITMDVRTVAVLVSARTYVSWRSIKATRGDGTLMRDVRSGLPELKSSKSKLYTLEELLG